MPETILDISTRELRAGDRIIFPPSAGFPDRVRVARVTPRAPHAFTGQPGEYDGERLARGEHGDRFSPEAVAAAKDAADEHMRRMLRCQGCGS